MNPMGKYVYNLKISMSRIEHSIETANEHLKKIEEKISEIERQNVSTQVNVGKLEAKTGLISTVLGSLAGYFSGKI